MRKLCLATAIMLLTATGAKAGTPYQEKLTCPIGGEIFEHTFTASHSTFGSRPDGKPYGSWTFPMPIPVCPGNKLPIYEKFSTEKLAKLEPLVASAEFRALADDTAYYRAAWLMQRTEESEKNVAWMIVQASWEADDQPALKRRYQEEYVSRIMAVPEGDDKLDWLFYQIRAANGLRELSRFSDAVALIENLQPHAQAVLASAKAPSNAKGTDDEELESAQYVVTFLERLKKVAGEQNNSSEPIAMLDPRTAQIMCRNEAAKLNAQDRAACAILPADQE